jgi:hypothetical protein
LGSADQDDEQLPVGGHVTFEPTVDGRRALVKRRVERVELTGERIIHKLLNVLGRFSRLGSPGRERLLQHVSLAAEAKLFQSANRLVSPPASGILEVLVVATILDFRVVPENQVRRPLPRVQAFVWCERDDINERIPDQMRLPPQGRFRDRFTGRHEISAAQRDGRACRTASARGQTEQCTHERHGDSTYPALGTHTDFRSSAQRPGRSAA